MGHHADCNYRLGHTCDCGFTPGQRPPCKRQPIPADCSELTFWLVWRVTGQSPTKMHISFVSAQQEAQRLSALNPNVKFVVMRAEWSVAVRQTPTTITSTFVG